MKVISSSPYAPFNSKEWNSLISKNAKFENTPIKIQKKFYKTFTLKSKQKMEYLLFSKSILLLVQMYYYDMKVISSSPYAPFNSKEWNSLISKNVKFEDTPIKIQKKFYRTFTLKKIEKDELSQEKNELHQQMQLVFG